MVGSQQYDKGFFEELERLGVIPSRASPAPATVRPAAPPKQRLAPAAMPSRSKDAGTTRRPLPSPEMNRQQPAVTTSPTPTTTTAPATAPNGTSPKTANALARLDTGSRAPSPGDDPWSRIPEPPNWNTPDSVRDPWATGNTGTGTGMRGSPLLGGVARYQAASPPLLSGRSAFTMPGATTGDYDEYTATMRRLMGILGMEGTANGK